MKKVAFYTLGCKVNQYETEAMTEAFERNGYRIVESDEEADVYVVNTCTVTNLSDRKSRQFIRKSKRMNPEAIIAVVGCYAQTAPEEVASIDGVNVIVGTNDRGNIVHYVEQAMARQDAVNYVTNIMEIKEFEEMKIGEIKGRHRAYLKIQEGCNQFCTYCIIPYARGPIRSRKIDDIMVEVQRLAQNGFKEIVLTGIHVASYGKDLGDVTLLDVIKAIHPVEGIERIRLSSIEPTIMTKAFIQTLLEYHKVCPHFHLSLQSGCNETLKRMNRKYTTEVYKEIVHLIRECIPDVSITTDIMVGFPGETEEEFQKTLHFVKEIEFSQIHVFKYSPRKGTPAAKYEGQVPSTIKNQRSEELIALANACAEAYNQRFIGRDKKILFEEQSKELEGYYQGFTDNYIRVLAKSESNVEGALKSVRLDKVHKDGLIGTIIG
ncbi:MAG: tRNA (N(6)-L-threonylcarbamoyladenosine(37)-C(2))-methylthiotransferase MtaB [Bacillota bacterium]